MQILTNQTNEDGSPVIEEDLTHEELAERVSDGRLPRDAALFALAGEMAVFIDRFWKPAEFGDVFEETVELLADMLHQFESDEGFERVH